MRIISPIAVTESILTGTNLTEDDHDEWDVSTTYDAEDRVIVLSTHKVYEGVAGSNLGYDPTTDDGTWWIEVSATNKWKAFDLKLSDQAQNAGTITYEITAASLITGIAFFNLSAAEITITVSDTDSSAVETYSKTISLVDDGEIVDWFSFFTTDLDNYRTQALIVDLAAYVGYKIDITIGDGTGTAGVGQVVLGKVDTLGNTLEGTTIGLTSFSTKEQDDWGNWTIRARAKSDPVNFQFSMPATGAARTQRILNALRDTPAVYFAADTLVESHGAITFGLFQDYEIPLRANGVSIVQLEIEGLT